VTRAPTQPKTSRIDTKSEGQRRNMFAAIFSSRIAKTVFAGDRAA
jgi:hypothetical protein